MISRRTTTSPLLPLTNSEEPEKKRKQSPLFLRLWNQVPLRLYFAFWIVLIYWCESGIYSYAVGTCKLSESEGTRVVIVSDPQLTDIDSNDWVKGYTLMIYQYLSDVYMRRNFQAIQSNRLLCMGIIIPTINGCFCMFQFFSNDFFIRRR